MNKSLAALLIAAPLLAASLPGTAAPVLNPGVNIVVNGSFEDTDAATAGIQPQATSSWGVYASLPGWTSTNGIEVRNANAGTAQDGVDFLELDVYQNSTISQTLSTVAGHLYNISFWYAPRILGVNAGSTNDIAVIWNGSTLATETGNTAGWVHYSYNVTAQGNDVLSFAGVGTSDGAGGSLDNVSVSAVPEPGALSLAGLALLGAGAARRRLRA